MSEQRVGNKRCADVAIVGAGVIGSAIAYTLSRATALRVVVVEREVPGCEASNAAAGVLAVASGHARQGVLLDLRRRSAAMFPGLVEELEEETGVQLGYRRDGLISLAFSETEAAALQDLVQHRNAQGLRGEMLSRGEVQELEPAVSSRVCAAALFPDDRSINNERLVAALVRGAQRRGVEFRLHSPVQSLSTEGGTVRLQLGSGPLEAGVAVVAAGAWSVELLAHLGVKVPLRPARGEMAAVQSHDWTLRHTVTADPGYLVPRGGGEVLIGSTTAFVGFDAHVTPQGVATLLANAEAMVPKIGGTVPLRSWAGLRPCPTIRRPIIAFLPGLDNVLLATGHHRNGILLAPITAQLVTELITGTVSTVPMRPFGYRRH
ncbi:MAG: glycine oxidase ThiO [Candidatus Binatia bacterium]